ncbi:MAG TPA: hypothetical protein VLB01_06210 [Thermodesulfobacteriota bacterium]|nr:hypothetical protein [Thermodesulfobacteriota bacterium]
MSSVIKTFLAFSFLGMVALANPEFFHIFKLSPEGQPENRSGLESDYEEQSEVKTEEKPHLVIHRKPIQMTYYEVKQNRDIKPEPLQQTVVWRDKYSNLSEYSVSEETRRLAEEHSASELHDKMLYWYMEYLTALDQSGWTDETSYAYVQYKEHKEAFEIRNRF